MASTKTQKTAPKKGVSKKLAGKSGKAAPAKKQAPASLVTPAARIAEARAAAFADTHPEKAFNHFRPLAEAVPLADLPIFTGQPLLMRANVVRALEAVAPHLESAVARLPDAPVREVLELPGLTLALDFATARVPLAKLSAREIDGMLDEGGPWRELMLRYLEVASHPLLGLLPAERVRAVRAGSGKLDKARDFVALPGLFTEFAAALDGKHPFPAEKIEMLGTLGSALVQQIRPGRAPVDVPTRGPEALLRDRFAALVEERYDALQVLASVAVGRRKADELLPPLRSSIPSGSAEEAPADTKGGAPVNGQAP
ncbi:hypothetical protein A7982_12691 [Minicystis rosea]|nr:hypothetical protein A7982_12691 [Minicystis rosea]